MKAMSEKDRLRLRALAQKQLEYANCEKNEKILRQWKALAAGRKEAPTVRLLFSNFRDEVIYSRMECESEEARKLEAVLLGTLVGRELFDDDTPIAPTFDIAWDTWASPFGITRHQSFAKGDNVKGYHIDPVVEDLAEEIDKLRGGSFGIDREKTLRRKAFAEEIFGDIEDEHDNSNYIIKQVGENDYVLSARLEIDKVNDKFNLNLPESEDYMTVGGLILHHYQSFPKLNEIVTIGNFEFKIMKNTMTKIELVKLKVLK